MKKGISYLGGGFLATGWFVDGAYLLKAWSASQTEKLNYLKLRSFIEMELKDQIDEAYYLNADPDPQNAQQNAFHNFLAYPPPKGPGLRVKLYWLQRRQLYWPGMMGGGPVVHPATGEHYILTYQKAVDVGLAFHVMRSYFNRRWDKLVLCGGDGDFHEVVQFLVENHNVDLYLIGSLETISEQLRPYARKIYELPAIAPRIAGL